MLRLSTIFIKNIKILNIFINIVSTLSAFYKIIGITCEVEFIGKFYQAATRK